MRIFYAAALLWLLLLATPSVYADTFAFLPRTDGTIVRFRADKRTGKLVLLPGTVDTKLHRLVTLVLSADKHFLYAYYLFNVDKDGYRSDFETPRHDLAKATRSKPTTLLVFALQKGGGLHQIQTITVPGPVGQIAVHPSGRFVYALTDGGAFLLKSGSAAKPLTYIGRVGIKSGMGLVASPGERDAWWLTFSPSGKYLYDFSGDGFVDHSENYLQRYRIKPATGQTAKDGNEWADTNEDVRRQIAGRVCYFVNRTAFVQGLGEGFAALPVDKNERIISRKGAFRLKPTKHGDYFYDPNLIPHPKRPLVFYRGSYPDPYTFWRITAPGKAKKVGAFASAFGTKPSYRSHQITFSPDGRFLYETVVAYNYVAAPLVAVFAVSPNGTKAKLSVPPCPLPFGTGGDLTLCE